MVVERVAVIGAGTMGRGVATDLLLHGVEVTLIDNSPQALAAAVSEIHRTARMAGLARASLRRDDLGKLLGQLHTTTELADAAASDAVIENIVEDAATKRGVYGELGRVCPPATSIAANTSCIPISWLGEASGRPDKTIGIHLMNPAWLQRTVELIRGDGTEQACVDHWLGVLHQLGKSAEVIADVAGFVSSRVSHVMINEAVRVIEEGVATPQQVDRIFRECHDQRLGPLQTADLIGLDTVVRALRVLHDRLGGTHYQPAQILVDKVAAGELGRKTGRGFYDYPAP